MLEIRTALRQLELQRCRAHAQRTRHLGPAAAAIGQELDDLLGHAGDHIALVQPCQIADDDAVTDLCHLRAGAGEILHQVGLVEDEQSSRLRKTHWRADQGLIGFGALARHRPTKLHPQRIELGLVQQAHGPYQEPEESILGLATDLDQVLEAQQDRAVDLGEADLGDLRNQPEIALQSPTEIHQSAAGGQCVAHCVKMGKLHEPGDVQAEVRVVGHLHAGSVQPGQGGCRQAVQRVVGQVRRDSDRLKDTCTVYPAGFQRPGDCLRVAGDGGGLLCIFA
ncbi:hypothetical protein D3C78_1060270 [compost metagenome]